MGNAFLGKGVWGLLAAVVVVVFVVFMLNMPDQRTTGQRVGDAVDALPHGVNKAAAQLSDRTPVQKAGDALQKADDKAKPK